jgi:hypothetical protein
MLIHEELANNLNRSNREETEPQSSSWGLIKPDLLERFGVVTREAGRRLSRRLVAGSVPRVTVKQPLEQASVPLHEEKDGNYWRLVITKLVVASIIYSHCMSIAVCHQASMCSSTMPTLANHSGLANHER